MVRSAEIAPERPKPTEKHQSLAFEKQFRSEGKGSEQCPEEKTGFGKLAKTVAPKLFDEAEGSKARAADRPNLLESINSNFSAAEQYLKF